MKSFKGYKIITLKLFIFINLLKIKSFKLYKKQLTKFVKHSIMKAL